MKRNLLFCLALASAISASAQVLETENYNSYTLGNVAASTTGTVAGQGGMTLYNGAAADYQIVNGDAAHGKYLQVTGGSDGTAASSRYVFKSGLEAAWAARTPGNNIIKGRAEIYTGTSTNQHASGVAIYGADDGIVGVRYNSQTKLMTGLAYLDTGLSGAFYTITGISATVYPANTWVTVGYSYNKTTGDITYTIGNAAPLTLTVNGATTVADIDPTEFDVYSSPYRASATAPVNTGPTTFGIDNYSVHAGNNTTLATVENDARKSSIIAIGPNPTADYLNILTEMKITNLEIFDMSGKKLPAQLEGNKVDVKNLNSGSYIVSFETKDGKTIEKFIKK
ncbi:T9SS type A sorting domain-containing protein [Chryseobacterium sp. L7]|uniref:T9SS type A sorting domain-containing protein n=1 Tax=Chryseobacterium endalhagicum TaxID=2797638 RepID=A0ABS1QE31_9FLAO|nr:T9SS type A sorting domain-containing protein [Chryseobacterium endalhagicum]MBL1220859.1 T9SS type A sorting domain-containing protein [Chryseobacterium endalhagicum]